MSCGMMHGVGKGYCYFARACRYLQSPLLLLIRLYWGWHFFQSGLAKLGHIESVVDFFQTLGIPFPLMNAYFVGIVECVGGLCLLLGLFSHLAALFLAGTMIVALLTAHPQSVKNIFENPTDLFSQDPFLYLYASLIILAFGAGAFSIDWLWQKSCSSKCSK